MIRTMVKVAKLSDWKWRCLACDKVYRVPPAERCDLCHGRDFDLVVVEEGRE